jgi:hypothetical protein
VPAVPGDLDGLDTSLVQPLLRRLERPSRPRRLFETAGWRRAARRLVRARQPISTLAVNS